MHEVKSKEFSSSSSSSSSFVVVFSKQNCNINTNVKKNCTRIKLTKHLFFVLLFSLPFLLVMPHTPHVQEPSPTSIALLFLQSCLNICL